MIDFDKFCVAALPQLGKYARLLTGDRDRAHDLVVDTLIAAHRRWTTIGAMANTTGYVRAMVWTTYLRERRRWYSRNVTLTSSGELPERSTGDATNMVDARIDVAVALARLTPRQRNVLVLRYYLDLSDREIAAEIGGQESTVRSLLRRALAVLRLNETHDLTEM